MLDERDRFTPKSHSGVPVAGRERVGGSDWRLTLDGGRTLDAAACAGRAVLLYRRYKWTQAVVISECAWTDLRDVEVWGAPEFAVYCESSTGTHFRRCHVRPKPGSGRLGGLNADGLHARSNRFGPFLYECSITRVQDDCLNLQSKMVSVDAVLDDRTLVIDVPWEPAGRLGYWSPLRGDFRPGDRLAFVDPETSLLAGHAVIETAASHPWREWTRTRITLDRPVPDLRSREAVGKRTPVRSSSEFLGLTSPEPTEHFVLNASTKSDGFVVRDCTLGDNTVTCGKIKAGNGLIVGNRTSNHGWCVWSFATEYVWQEGYAARRVLVEGNHFDNWFGVFMGSGGLFGRDHAGTPLNFGVTIRGNTFANVARGELAVDVNAVVGCVITGNVLPDRRPVAVGPNAVGVEISDNRTEPAEGPPSVAPSAT